MNLCEKCGGSRIGYRRESSGRLFDDGRPGYRTIARCENCGHLWIVPEVRRRKTPVVVYLAIALLVVAVLLFLGVVSFLIFVNLNVPEPYLG